MLLGHIGLHQLNRISGRAGWALVVGQWWAHLAAWATRARMGIGPFHTPRSPRSLPTEMAPDRWCLCYKCYQHNKDRPLGSALVTRRTAYKHLTKHASPFQTSGGRVGPSWISATQASALLGLPADQQPTLGGYLLDTLRLRIQRPGEDRKTLLAPMLSVPAMRICHACACGGGRRIMSPAALTCRAPREQQQQRWQRQQQRQRRPGAAWAPVDYREPQLSPPVKQASMDEAAPETAAQPVSRHEGIKSFLLSLEELALTPEEAEQDAQRLLAKDNRMTAALLQTLSKEDLMAVFEVGGAARSGLERGDQDRELRALLPLLPPPAGPRSGRLARRAGCQW